MDQRRLGRNGPLVSPLGFGAFKIGRNEQTKYGQSYALPEFAEVERLLNGVLDLGVNFIDTAPAYGISEERIGQTIARRRSEYVLSTKVGEIFEQGQSRYDFSGTATEQSLSRSLQLLKTDWLDVVFIHATGDDLRIINETDVVPTLLKAREEGFVRQIGLSAKTVAAATEALNWADVLMLEYHLEDRRMEPVIAAAATRGIGVVVKKALASGKLPAQEALRFVANNSGVSSIIVGTLKLAHLEANLAAIS